MASSAKSASPKPAARAAAKSSRRRTKQIAAKSSRRRTKQTAAEAPPPLDLYSVLIRYRPAATVTTPRPVETLKLEFDDRTFYPEVQRWRYVVVNRRRITRATRHSGRERGELANSAVRASGGRRRASRPGDGQRPAR
jgi:hypothetical protein